MPNDLTDTPFPWTTGEAAGERQLRIRAHGTLGPVAGAASYSVGLSAHSGFSTCPACVLPEPLPDPGRVRPGGKRLRGQFHAPTRGAPGDGLRRGERRQDRLQAPRATSDRGLRVENA